MNEYIICIVLVGILFCIRIIWLCHFDLNGDSVTTAEVVNISNIANPVNDTICIVNSTELVIMNNLEYNEIKIDLPVAVPVYENV